MTSGRLGLVAVLVGSLVLSVAGLDWGLPNAADWAVDSVHAEQILQTYNNGLRSGWIQSYPPLHARLLAAVWAVLGPVAERDAPPAGGFDYVMPDGTTRRVSAGPERTTYIHTMATFMARGVTVIMSLGTLVWVYAIGRRVWSPSAGFWAALLVSWTHAFVFYSHTSNREVPQLFWLAGCLYFFVRCGQDGRLWHYIGLAVFAALAAATKDQALGLLPLMGMATWGWIASEKEGRVLGRLARALADRRLLTALTVFLLLLAANHDLYNPSQWPAFAAHVKSITGPDREAYRMFDLTPAGEWAMLVRTTWMTGQAIGLPLAVGGVLAIGVSLVRERAGRFPRALLVPPLSYYLFFLCLVLYVWVRWTLPIALVLCLFAGRWLATLWALPGRSGRVVRIAVGLLLAATFWHGASASALMLFDARYKAEPWLAQWARRHRRQRPWVLTFSGETYLPRWLDPNLYVVPIQRIKGPTTQPDATLDEAYRRVIAQLVHGPTPGAPDPLLAVRGRGRYLLVITEPDLGRSPFLVRLIEGRDPDLSLVARFQTRLPLAPRVIGTLNPTIYLVGPRESENAS